MSVNKQNVFLYFDKGYPDSIQPVIPAGYTFAPYPSQIGIIHNICKMYRMSKWYYR